MSKPDDSTLTPSQYLRVRKEAERALADAGAIGVFPTPIERIMAVAEVEEVPDQFLSDAFIESLRARAGAALKRAVSKVIGLFHASEGLVYIDQTLHAVKKRFVRLHEAGHGFMPWQRSMYAVVEDCDKSLDPEAAMAFDREANVFASEVLFQLDMFTEMAASEPFSIWVPVRLSKRFDASIYASIRQYVSKSHYCCVVVIIDKPQLDQRYGFRADLRRIVASRDFETRFGSMSLPDYFTPQDRIGAMIPTGGRKASGKREMQLTDLNGDKHRGIAEAFTQTYQVFVLIHVEGSLPTGKIYLG